jgi:hypothetical protein
LTYMRRFMDGDLVAALFDLMAETVGKPDFEN